MTNALPPENSGELVNYDDEINLLDLLSVVAENIRLLIIGPLIAGIIAYGVSSQMTPIFTAKTTITPPGQSSGGGASMLLEQLGGFAALAGAAGGIKNSTEYYIALLQSNVLIDQLVDPFKLVEHYQVQYPNQARSALKKASKIISEKKSGFIVIEVSDKNPEFAMKMANAYVKALSELLGKFAIEDARSRQNFLEQQINLSTEKSYRSPFVREAIIQSIVREYETALLDQKKDRAYIQQIDIAEIPKSSSKPDKRLISALTALATELLLLVFVFFRYAHHVAIKNPASNIRINFISSSLRKQFFLGGRKK